MTTLFLALNTYYQCWSSHYSFIKFLNKFLCGCPMTPMTEYHAHLDYHLYRTEMAQRNQALPPIKVMWEAIQTLLTYHRVENEEEDDDQDEE